MAGCRAITSSDSAARHRALAGLALTRRSDLPGALAAFRAALASDADCYEAWIGLTHLFFEIGDADRAAACLEIARRMRRDRRQPERRASF